MITKIISAVISPIIADFRLEFQLTTDDNRILPPSKPIAIPDKLGFFNTMLITQSTITTKNIIRRTIKIIFSFFDNFSMHYHYAFPPLERVIP